MFIGPGPGLPLLFAHLAHQQYTKNGTSYRPTHKRRTEQKKMTRKWPENDQKNDQKMTRKWPENDQKNDQKNDQNNTGPRF